MAYAAMPDRQGMVKMALRMALVQKEGQLQPALQYVSNNLFSMTAFLTADCVFRSGFGWV